MSECVFCEIVAGAEEAAVLLSDPVCMVILDVRPVNPGHVLILPKNHHEGIVDMPSADFVHIAEVAHEFARHMREAFTDVEGINILMSEGEAASQSVGHSHMHVIPRKEGDSMKLESDDPFVGMAELNRIANLWSQVQDRSKK